MSSRTTRTRPGLTLIEVLLGLVIMLMALVAIGRLVDIGTDRVNEARMTTRGTRLAQSKMAEVEAGAIALADGTQSGTFDEEPAWSWSVEPQQQGPANLYLVTVRVSRDVNGRTFEVTLYQYILDPTVMGTAAQATKPSTSTTTTGTGGTQP
ncbi:MAG TPA: hypothetical protein VKE74_24995 [Gemmataceae bacterium]|nr:hypothetical protein [Gemmataceae bacterium]